jgi:hypothetical protein
MRTCVRDLARERLQPVPARSCLHAFEVATGLEEGPFDQRRAERFGRTLLMPATQFAAVADENDRALAEWFGACRAGRAEAAELRLPAHGSPD